jgi:hypothetical protein
METRETYEPTKTGSADKGPVASFEAGSGAKRKKALGVGVNP